MRGRDIISAIMKKTETSNSVLANRLGVTPAVAWDRVNNKKVKDIPVSLMADMLRVMDYKVVVVPSGTKMGADWFEVS